MGIREAYISLLYKQAAEEVIDNQKEALSEFSETKTDSREVLSGMFDNANTFGNDATKDVKRLFPGDSKKESGNPFLKLARSVWYESVILKTASAAYREVACRSFVAELDTISGR
jgi:hypothetical protein